MAPTRKCLWPQIHWAVEILQPWFCSFISLSELPTLVTHFLPYLHFHLVWPPLCLVFSPWWHWSHSLSPCPGVPQKCPSFLKFCHGLFYLLTPTETRISCGSTTSLANFPNERFFFSFPLPIPLAPWVTQSPGHSWLTLDFRFLPPRFRWKEIIITS